LDDIENELARRRLLRFITRTMPTYRAGWFHERLASELQSFLKDVLAKKAPRLIVVAPPQHGKSEIISRRFPAFALGVEPRLRVIAVTYSGDRAGEISRDVQRIIDSQRYHEIFPGTCIAGQFASTTRVKRTDALWEVAGQEQGPAYRAVGVRSGITGGSAEIVLIDDPIKDMAEALSDTIRETIWNEYLASIRTRVQSGGGICVIATRWHQDDLIGRLLAYEPGQWKLVHFPAIAEEDEPPYRNAGDALSPERFTLDDLLRFRDNADGKTTRYVWSALYQGHPSPPGGGLFKRDDWQFYKQIPDHFDEILQSWDCTFKDTDGSDYVCGGVIGVKGPHKYILDLVRDRLSFRGTKTAIRTLSGKWPEAYTKLIEDKANGPAVINDLKDEIPGFIAVEPEGGKLARAHAVSGEVEAHNVWLPDATVLHAPWVHDFIEECAGFPTAAFDDQVDMLTQALARIRAHSMRLGLVDYLKSTQAERDQAAKAARTVVDSLNGASCPQCQSTAVGRVGGQKRCNACGYQWPSSTGTQEPVNRKNLPHA
jgi:predicted phage terminase large subunit-like protein